MKHLFIIILFIPHIFLGQAEKAEEYYTHGYYNEAIQEFNSELKNKKLTEVERFEIRKKLANSYYKSRDLKNSLKEYELIFSKNSTDSLTLIRLIELNRNFCDYQKAKTYLELYTKQFLTCDNCEIYADYLNNIQVLWPEKNQQVGSETMDQLKEFKIGQFGMGYTFFENNELIAGFAKDTNFNNTSFYDLAIVKLNDYSEKKDLSIPDYNHYYRAFPSYSSHSKTLYFTSNSTDKKNFNPKKQEKKGYSSNGQNTLQLFETKQISNTEFDTPKSLSFCDVTYNFTHPCINKEGDKIYFVSDIPGGYGGYDVYYSLKKDGTWSKPINCGPVVNSKFDELTPFIHGDSLFYSSYGNNGYGGSDVFLAVLEKNEIKSTKNMGLPINSCKDDFSFLITNDLSYGFLTSNRTSSTQGSSKDFIYKITFPEEEFNVSKSGTTDPISDVVVTILENDENIVKKSTNSEGNWFARLKANNTTTATFDHPYYETKTVRLNSNSLDELKNISLDPFMINGRVVDAITNKRIQNVNVKLYEINPDSSLALVNSAKTNANGEWEFNVSKEKDYKIILERNEYEDGEGIIPRQVRNNELFIEAVERLNPYELSLKPVTDNKLQIDNIYFDFNKSSIRQESYPILDNLYKFLEKNSSVKIELSAHTDCIGNDSYNLKLSQKRAQSCYHYLVEKGIDKNRIVAKGYGEQKMIAPDCEKQRTDDSYAQKNRRVEVKVL